MGVWDSVFDPEASDAEDELGPPELLACWLVPGTGEKRGGRPLTLSLHVGDLVAVSAEAVCTSTNPRLSLWAGTGAAVLRRGGWEVKRLAEAVVGRERRRTGRHELEPGSVHPTAAGHLPHQVVVHCVASDAGHRSSPQIVQRCVEGALAAAEAAGCATVAMPVFATGQASLDLETAVEAMVRALRSSAGEGSTVEEVMVTLPDAERAAMARTLLDGMLEPAPA